MVTANEVLACIGNTPLVRVAEPADSGKTQIFAKLEQFNLTGSVKARAVMAMIAHAERNGQLNEKSTLVEATSGNTGIAIACLAAARGYKAVIVMPDSVSPKKVQHIQAYGANVVFTPAVFGMKRAFADARRIAKDIENSFIPDQSCNPINVEAHRTSTGPEIWEQLGGTVDVFVAGVGTGGTLTGVALFLRERNPRVRIVAVEPRSSPILSSGRSGPHSIEGIGAGFVPDILQTDLIDEVETVADEEARASTEYLAKRHGLFVGISSGAAAAASFKIARRAEYQGKTVATVFADSGERYPQS
jgi:cysteine synthase A